MLACSFMLQWFMLLRFSISASICSFFSQLDRCYREHNVAYFFIAYQQLFNAYCFRKKMWEGKIPFTKINGKLALAIKLKRKKKRRRRRRKNASKDLWIIRCNKTMNRQRTTCSPRTERAAINFLIIISTDMCVCVTCGGNFIYDKQRNNVFCHTKVVSEMEIFLMDLKFKFLVEFGFFFWHRATQAWTSHFSP